MGEGDATSLRMLAWTVGSVLLTALMLVSLWRVARRQRGGTVALVAVIVMVVGTVASSLVLWRSGVVLSLALDGSAVWSAMVSMAVNIGLHLLAWALLAWTLVRMARA